MSEGRDGPVADRISRRTFIKKSGAAGAAVLGGTLWATAPAAARAKRARAASPIKHVIISMQENRSFDHYYGSAPQVRAAGQGWPDGWSETDRDGGRHVPIHLTSLTSPDPPHSWSAVHSQINGGAMNKFWQTSQDRIGNGDAAMYYYTAAELPFYYSLFANSALCANYFCSVLGPTWPNRFYVAAGTSGGITTNGVWGYGVFNHPMILDLLDNAGVSWKVYNNGFDSVPYGNTDNVFLFWERYQHDPRALNPNGQFFNDLRRGELPQVSWIIPSYAHEWDEHPPADVSVGMGFQQQYIDALRASSAWDSTAFLLTYDEHGGFFDHVTPPTVDAFGLGVRVPLWVVSKYAKAGVQTSAKPADHTSTLKLIETLFNLPTLASQNHQFDTSTPSGSNYQAPGNPPAPPRDGNAALSDLLDLFRF